MKSKSKKAKKNLITKTLNTIKSFFGNIVGAFGSLGQEIKRIEFPDFKNTIKMTSIVMTISIILTLVLLGLDYVFALGRNYLTNL